MIKNSFSKNRGFIRRNRSFFGIPAKNVLRDIRSVVNVVRSENIFKTTKSGIENSILNEFGSISKGEELYFAIIDGDRQHETRIREELESGIPKER